MLLALLEWNVIVGINIGFAFMAETRSDKFSHESELAFKERRAFERDLPLLLPKYRGRYVAFLGGRAIDDDENDESLARRMFAKFGETPFYIGSVEDPPAVYELPSPESID
jgi:hypothetical protein